MKISLRGEYALQALMALAQEAGPEVVRIQSIAEREDIPKRFLEQILNDLRAGGFVESKRGIAGGYRLRNKPEEISVAAVLKRVEGSLSQMTGPNGTDHAPNLMGREKQRAIRGMMSDVCEEVAKMLDCVTVADLCRRAEQCRSRSAGSADYSI